jgi:hypothetical protein
MIRVREYREAVKMFLATSMMGVVASMLLIALSGCSETLDIGVSDPGHPQRGDTRFLSANPYGNSFNAADASAPGAEDMNGGREQGAERTVEEADVIRLDGNRLFILNAYRGLEIVDVTNVDAPVILGDLKVYGYPVEMYIDGTRAYIVVSNYFTYWRGLAENADVEEWRGSQIVIADISNPALPTVVKAVNIEGYISDTRKVGDVLYVVSNRYAWWTCASSDDTVDLTFAASIDIFDPENIHEVERLSFPGSSNFINVTQNAIFVAQYFWNWREVEGTYDYGSTVTYVDISDAFGHIQKRGTFAMPGYLRDRYSMDWFEDSFRIVTYFWEGAGHSELRTFDTTNPDAIAAQGTLVIEDAGQLMATRFAGERAYTIHLPRSNIDPLDVIDLADPMAPQLKAVLEIPGTVNHIEVRGMRLLALGVDSLDWNERKVSVKLFDVTQATAPVLLDEAPVGLSQSWSAAAWDPKALTILDDQGLILVPFDAWSTTNSAYDRGVALVSWVGDKVDARGVAATKGNVTRTRAVDERMLATSPDLLEVFDITDRNLPVATAAIELAWNVADFVTLGDYGVQLVGDYWTWWDGAPTRELRVVPLGTPDTAAVLARITLDAPYGRLFQHGSLITVASYNYADSTTKVQVFDFVDPIHPVLRGSVEVPCATGFDYYGGMYNYWGGYYGGGEIIELPHGLAIHPSGYYWYGVNDAAGTTDGTPADKDEIWIVDLQNPDAPEGYRIGLSHYGQQLRAQADTLFYTYWEPVTVPESPYGWAAYYVGRILLGDTGAVTHLPGINIPGYFVEASEDATLVYTLDYTWTEAGSLKQSFNALELFGTYAQLVGRIDFPEDGGYLSGLTVKDGIAYIARQTYSWECNEPPRMTLSTVDVGDPENLPTLSSFVSNGYGYLMDVQYGRAFLNMGWGEGMMVLDVADPAQVALLNTFRTQGYPVAIRLTNDVAYLPSGYYGVQVFELSDGMPL